MISPSARVLLALAFVTLLGAPVAAQIEPVAPAVKTETTAGPAAASKQPAPAPQGQPAAQAVPATTPARVQPAAPAAPATTPAQVQPAAAPAKAVVPTKPDEVQKKLDSWKVEIDQIVAGIQREGQTDKHLAELRERAERIRGATTDLVTAESPRLVAVEARLKQLGPAPQAKEDEPAAVEAEAVKVEREDQQKQLAETQGRIKQAQLLQLRAEEIIKTVGDRRRERFTRELVERSRSVIDPTLWLQALKSMPGTLSSLRYLVGDWASLMAERGFETAVAVGSVILALVLVLFATRRRLALFVARDPSVHEPPRLRKAAVAAGIVALNLLVPLVGLYGTTRALEVFELNPERISQFLDAVILGVGGAAAVYGVALALFAPSKPQWRLVAVGDHTATRLVQLSVVLSVVHGFGIAASRATGVLAMPVTEVIVLSGVIALAEAVIVMAALKSAARALSGEDAAPAPEVVGDEAPPARSVLWRWIVPLGWIVAIAAVVAAASGYVALAAFMTSQLVRTGLLIGILYIVLQLVDEVIQATFHEDTRLGVLLTRSMGLSRETVEQIGVVLSGFTRLFVIALATLVALTPIGVSSQDVAADAKTIFFGFTIGGLTFSLSTILTAVAFLMIGIGVTRGIQGWLDERFLPRTRLDVGLKNSIRTAFGYVGYVLAVMLAFSVVGLDLQNIAIVAGALSVGIGFGLQSIVNNFVSGLILLVERPIKAGDLVEIGTEKGYVRKINVRSTEIETFDRAALIVPNSSLISGNVKNWMHRDLTGRCLINVGVAYTADPNQVREVLLACAEEHPKVLSFPAPGAFFVNFGDNALEFRLICTTGNVSDAFGVESELRFAIVARLRELGIDIPFVQRDIHIRQLDDLRALADAFLASRPPAGSPTTTEGGA